jgi:autotransporter-associated beta strand protein
VLWDAKFRNSTLNSQFFAPGASPTASAALNVVKAGDGWATMTLDNDYTGTTTVAAGILQVGRNSVGDTGAVNAAGFSSAAGTTIAGTGQIQGAATILGHLSPGDEAGASMGTLTFVSSATFGATSDITLQAQRSSYTAMNTVGYDTAGYSTWVSGITTDPTYSHLLNDPVTSAQHDQILVGGALTIVTGSKITLVNNGYNAAAGDVFKLLDWNGANLTYNVGGVAYNGGLFRTGAETGTDLDLFELGSGFRWDVSLFDTQGIIIVVVPEPGRLLLLMFGLLGLCMRRRRRFLK